MTISNLKVIIAGDAAGAIRAFSETKKAAEDAAKGSSSAFDKSTSKVGGAFSKLGNSLSNWGLPFGKSISDIGAKLESAQGKGAKFSGIMSDVGKTTLQAGALGFLAAGAEAVKMGMSFQTSMTQLVTGAGESQKAIGMVSQGVLNMAAAVGQSPQALASGLYLIESAGYHGASGLDVLKASAEGAAVGNAQMSTVADATTSVLNAYGLSAKNSTSIVNQMIETVKVGKMHMQDLAGSLSAVIPIASAAGISYAQVGGALATMTSMGMSAQQGTQDLANTIRSLQNPNAVAVNEMQQLGINSNQVAKNLGKNGLTGTLSYLSETILKNMGPSGEVMLKAFNQSKAAGQDLQIMLQNMTPTMRNLANEFMSGKMNMTQFRKAMPTNEQGVIGQFTALYAKVNGFNAQLKAGLPASQTYEAALSKITGGATGLNTSLMLTGSHAAAFEANVKAVGTAAKATGDKVTGFALTQKDLQFQIEQAKAGAQALADKFGLVLIPWIEKGISAVGKIIGWFKQNKVIAEALAASVGTILAGAIGMFVASMAKAVVSSAVDFGKMILSGVKWVIAHGVQVATFIAQNVAMMASATAAFIAENAASLGIVAAIGLVVAGVVYLATHWKQVWGDVKKWVLDAWNFIRPIFDSIVSAIKTVTHAISDVTGVLGKIGGGVGSVISHVIPHLAKGGLVTRPTLALIGEAGPEMVVPLNRAGGMSLAQPGALPSGTATGSGNVIHITYAPQISVVPMVGTQVAKQLEDTLNTHDQVLMQQLQAHVA